MVFHFDGRYRSALECKFLEQVEEDLTQFWSICGDNSVLVFPSLSARYRFLIHQLVGQSSKLQTVSVGQGQERRTVVYSAPERYRNGSIKISIWATAHLPLPLYMKRRAKICYIIIDLILNLAYFRDPDKMAHSPSTSQKTFFGRGRGR